MQLCIFDPPCMYTWKMAHVPPWACDPYNPSSPPNLVIFSGTAASVIIGRSSAVHTFLQWHSGGGGVGGYVGISAGNPRLIQISAAGFF